MLDISIFRYSECEILRCKKKKEGKKLRYSNTVERGKCETVLLNVALTSNRRFLL